ncbi:MAG: glycoside hydrolase family 31 protein [Polyangia bacterium]
MPILRAAPRVSSARRCLSVPSLRSRGFGSVLALALAVASACDPPPAGQVEPPPPVRLAAGAFSLEVVPADASLVLRRDGEVLLRLPRDGFVVGTVDKLDDRLSYDPYWLEYGEDVLQPAEPPGLTWHRVDSLRPEASDGGGEGGGRFLLELEGGLTARLVLRPEREGRFSASLVPVETRGRSVAFLRLRPRIDGSEGLYGLGEWPDAVNHRGKVRPMQIEVDTTESANNEAHVPVPLLLGTRGWGLFVQSRRPGVFAVANKQPDLVEVTYGVAGDSPAALEFHLLGAARPIDLVRRYYDVTGEALLPAPWALGPWIWRNENRDQAQVLDDIKQIRDLDLATSAIWIDRPYASRVNSFDFEPRRFPDPAAMVKAVHAAGLRLALWHAPYLEKGSPDLDLARTSGFFPPENGVLLNNWSEPLDLTNPAAYAFWQERLRRYTTLGIEGFKLDYAEDVVVGLGSARSGWRFHDGSDERTMHYGYQLLYHRAYAELVPPPREGGGFLLCRTGRWGDQRSVSVIWPGDMDASFTQHRERYKTRSGKTVVGVGGLPATVAQGIGLGASGFPFFGADTGGYRDSPPDEELYRRWFQQTALSTVMQVGDASSQPPWEYNTENGRSAATLANYRTYARLHLRLFPYEWTYAQNLAKDGRPIQRAIGLAYPELGQHPMDEYLFGDDLLVAPVLERGARERAVLLPPGVWFDWDDGTRYGGGQTVRVAAPLDKLPLFVRGGGLVPLLRPDIDTLSPAIQAGVVSFASDEGKGPLVVRVAPGGEPTEFVVYDGTRLTQQRDARALSITPGQTFIRGARFEVRPAPPPAEVRVDGAPAPRAMTPADLEGQSVAFYYDTAGGGTLTIQVPAGPHAVEVK